jgi:hypothetical protein
MSHFTRIKTQLQDGELLQKALADLGFQNVEVHETAQHLYGWQGDVRPQTAEVVIRRRFIGPASNDIGFKRQADGTFDAIISEYDRRAGYSQEWLNRLTQRYAYHAVVDGAARQGFSVAEEHTEADGTVRVVVQRWR